MPNSQEGPKPFDKLLPQDWEQHPIWTYDLKNEGVKGRDETWMIPVTKLPVSCLDGCGCRAQASLNCGTPIFTILFSVDLNSARCNELFMTATFWLGGSWWHLSDRHFPDGKGGFETRTGSDLAKKLGLSMESVFPIKYDISGYAIGDANVLKGNIYAEPREKLNRKDRMKIWFERQKTHKTNSLS